MNRKDLTKKWLTSVGIRMGYNWNLDGEIKDRYVIKNSKRRGDVILKPIPQKGKTYLLHYYYCFCVKRKRYKISCARVIYALLNGVCPADKVVTYDDNGDLVLMTQKELYHKKVWERR